MNTKPAVRPRKMTAKIAVPARTMPGPELKPNVANARIPVRNVRTIASQARAVTDNPGARRSAGNESAAAIIASEYGKEGSSDRSTKETATISGETKAPTVNIALRTLSRHDSSA